MKRLIAMGAAVALATAAATTAVASKQPSGTTAAPAKITLCHKTGNGTFRRLIVSSRAVTSATTTAGVTLRAHLVRRGDAVIPGTAACPAASVTPSPTATPPAKITICHRTGSATNPFRRITVSSRAVSSLTTAAGAVLRGHLRHTGDLILPGAPACPRPTTVPGNQVKLDATLTPVEGATGSGTFDATLRLRDNELCYELSVTGLTSITAAHIHRLSDASIVVPLTTPTTGTSSGCVTVASALLQEIAATPGAFYVNVHTTAFPNGQVRGTLSR